MSNCDASNILVLDANQRSALAVTRSLGKVPSLRVWTADCVQRSLAGSSRYSRGYILCPSPQNAPEEFLLWLSDAISRHGFSAVFPVAEISSQLLLMNQACLGGCRLPFADYGTVMALADKGKLLARAQSLGIPVPDYQIYQKADEVDIEEIDTFPVVLKPCLSKVWTGTHWLSTDVSIVRDADTLRTALEKMRAINTPFMIQSFIVGHGAGLFALYKRGSPIAQFSHQRIREKPPGGGVSVVSESVAVNDDLQKHAHALLRSVGWHGVAMVEFRVATNGIPYLMEVNTRFWGSLQLAIDSGVDFPQLLWHVCMDTVDETAHDFPQDYRVGQRLRWLLGDLDNLYLTLRDSDYSLRQKSMAVFNFLKPGNGRHEINRWDDMGPALHELKEYLANLGPRRQTTSPDVSAWQAEK